MRETKIEREKETETKIEIEKERERKSKTAKALHWNRDFHLPSSLIYDPSGYTGDTFVAKRHIHDTDMTGRPLAGRWMITASE